MIGCFLLQDGTFCLVKVVNRRVTSVSGAFRVKQGGQAEVELGGKTYTVNRPRRASVEIHSEGTSLRLEPKYAGDGVASTQIAGGGYAFTPQELADFPAPAESG